MSHIKKGRLKTFALAAAAISLAAVLAVRDSKYNLTVTRYELEFDSLPAEFDGFRIVHISDLHGSIFGENNSSLARLIEQQQPDLIAMTGDFAGNIAELGATEGLLSELGDAAPIYFAGGNHEWVGEVMPRMRRLLAQYGAHCLENQYESFEKDGASIVIAGAEDPNGRADRLDPETFAELIREEHPDAFVLWLGHRNFWAEKYPALPVDLILSGHAHGGIIRLPLIGGLLNTSHRFIAEYEKGLYSGQRFIMEVSTGLGNSIFVPRLFNRPELVCITLRSAGS